MQFPRYLPRGKAGKFQFSNNNVQFPSRCFKWYYSSSACCEVTLL